MNKMKLPNGEPLTLAEGIEPGEQNDYGLFDPSKITPALEVEPYSPDMLDILVPGDAVEGLGAISRTFQGLSTEIITGANDVREEFGKVANIPAFLGNVYPTFATLPLCLEIGEAIEQHLAPASRIAAMLLTRYHCMCKQVLYPALSPKTRQVVDEVGELPYASHIAVYLDAYVEAGRTFGATVDFESSYRVLAALAALICDSGMRLLLDQTPECGGTRQGWNCLEPILVLYIEMVYGYRELNPEQTQRLVALHRAIRPNINYTNCYPVINAFSREFAVDAYDAGIIGYDDFYAFNRGRNLYDYYHKQDYYAAHRDKPSGKALELVAKHALVNEILYRKDKKPLASSFHLFHSCGSQYSHFVKEEDLSTLAWILCAMDSWPKIKRHGYIFTMSNFGGTFQTAEDSVLYKLLHLLPPEAPDATKLAVRHAGKDIADETPLRAAYYAPQWCALLGPLVGKQNLLDKVLFFHAYCYRAHDASYPLYDELGLGNFTSLSLYGEIRQGIVDHAWLERVAADPDQTLIDFLCDNAPLIATGESYRRPQLLLDAKRGKVSEEKLLELIGRERDADALLAYSILPPKNKAHKAEMVQLVKGFKAKINSPVAAVRKRERKAVKSALANIQSNPAL